jgi:hypothetical protein
MAKSIFLKNVVLGDYRWRPVGIEGLDVISRKEENDENYMTLTGTKAQINTYLQDKPIISEHLRTLKNLPTHRIIGTTKIRVQ